MRGSRLSRQGARKQPLFRGKREDASLNRAYVIALGVGYEGIEADTSRGEDRRRRVTRRRKQAHRRLLSSSMEEHGVGKAVEAESPGVARKSNVDRRRRVTRRRKQAHRLVSIEHGVGKAVEAESPRWRGSRT